MSNNDESSTIPGIGSLAEIAKAIPAAVAVLVFLSLIYEVAFLYPLGLGFLSFYTWQDFLHRVVVWLPIYVLWQVWGAHLATQVGLVLKARTESKKATEAAKAAGIEIKRSGRLRPVFKEMAKQPGHYVALIFFALIFANGIRAHPNPVVGWAFSGAAVYWTVKTNDGFEEFAKAFSSTAFNRKAMGRELLVLIFFITLWGAADGEIAIGSPETTQIELKTDAGSKGTRTCNVFRELTTVLLAVCDKHIIAINFASVVSIRYDIDVSKKFNLKN